ncbi:hypothetical protein FW774_16540 [Pedobacter sp. BS3]|uniref:hypothetical protein n=1 Tax=Pedobacter sp. BS3 TaxID=2567937 RepID=UPI0011EC5841|nr:hypothetical protein [Pedobacter sp. BS3]TZF82292.1 hypothetical protein FW774_16540 [Pedobacter sp. BS3]
MLKENGLPIVDLIKTIHHYYPIGLLNEEATAHYPGYQELCLLLERKINDIINNNLPEHCYKLFIQLKEQFSNQKFTVFDENYLQFPAYSYRINISEIQIENFRIITDIKIKISNLASYYTIFKEITIFDRVAPLGQTSERLAMYVIINKVDDMELAGICDTINNFFSGYEYLDHRLLMNIKITGGVPHGLQHLDKITFPIYSFLFDNYLEFVNHIVK